MLADGGILVEFGAGTLLATMVADYLIAGIVEPRVEGYIVSRRGGSSESDRVAAE